MSDSKNVRIHELVAYIKEGKILEAMQEFYAEEVVMTEPYHTTEGKQANIEREKQFVASVAEITAYDVKAIAIDGDRSLREEVMAWTTTEGQSMRVEQVAVAQWQNGQIVHERFYYNMG